MILNGDDKDILKQCKHIRDNEIIFKKEIDKNLQRDSTLRRVHRRKKKALIYSMLSTEL